MIQYVTKRALDKASNRAILLDYINSYASYRTAINTNRGTKALEKHLDDLANQLSRREILDAQDHRKLMYL